MRYHIAQEQALSEAHQHDLQGALPATLRSETTLDGCCRGKQAFAWYRHTLGY